MAPCEHHIPHGKLGHVGPYFHHFANGGIARPERELRVAEIGDGEADVSCREHGEFSARALHPRSSVHGGLGQVSKFGFLLDSFR